MNKRNLKFIILTLMFTTFAGCLNNGKKDNLHYKNKPDDDAIERLYELLTKSDMDGIVELFDENEDLDINENYFEADENQINALGFALIKGDIHLAEFLIKNMEAEQTIIKNPFYLSEAFRMDNIEMVTYILRKAKAMMESPYEVNYLLCWAINNNKLDIVRQVIEIFDFKDKLEFGNVASIFLGVKSLEVAKLLESYKIGINDDGYIQLNAFVGLLSFGNESDSFYDRAVGFIACYFMDKCSKEYLEYLWKNIPSASYPDVLEKFIDLGVDINMQRENSYMRTELISAVANHQLGAVKLLLQKGANANIPDFRGRNALFYALKSVEISEEIVRLLIPKTDHFDVFELIKFLERSKDPLKLEQIPLKLEILFKNGFKKMAFSKMDRVIFKAFNTLTAYNALTDEFMAHHQQLSIEEKKKFRCKAFFDYEIIYKMIYTDSIIFAESIKGLEKCLEDAGLSVNTILENGNSIFMEYCTKLKEYLLMMLECKFEEQEIYKNIGIALLKMVELKANANMRNIECVTCIGCLIECFRIMQNIELKGLKKIEELEYMISLKRLIIKILTDRYLELISEAGIMYQDQELKESHLNGESALKLVGTYTDIDKETEIILEKALFEEPLPEGVEYMNCREILDYALSKK